MNRKTGVISYGFAKYLREALPNASFIGFTETPINADDKTIRKRAHDVATMEILQNGLHETR